MKPDRTPKPAPISATTAPNSSILWRVAAILGRLLALLIVADVIGVGMCFLGDIIHPRGWSAGAVYAVWFVLGVFVGMIHQMANDESGSPQASADRPSHDAAKATFALGLAVTVVALLALTGLFHHMMWSRGIGSPDGYAPDSKSATLTFFITIIASMLFFRVSPPQRKALPHRRIGARRSWTDQQQTAASV